MQKYISIILLLFLSFNAFAQDTLKEVKVETKTKSTRKSYKSVTNTAVMTSKELLKAACCNLAESFETNPSIDVNFSDALTGTKQIKMLGLTSPYLMITEENRCFTSLRTFLHAWHLDRKYPDYKRCRFCSKWLRKYFGPNQYRINQTC